ncbi:type IV conjugative transfer system protein TraL [Pasteurella multocida]|uniref:type IV conjugative transfer system protein TraL n=1 Tax=Pasteurella multocida TaxID=747 RepID=UPI0035F2D085
MDSNKEKYLFPTTLSAQKRWFGLPTDEAIICIPLILLTVFSSMLVFGSTLIIVFLSIRKLKKGKGSSYVINLMYWFIPRSISSLFLWALPPSNFRYWIA